jgi:hypothetical protein
MNNTKKPEITKIITNAVNDYLKLKDMLIKSELEIAKQYSLELLSIPDAKDLIECILNKSGYNIDVNDIYFSAADISDDYCNSVYHYADINKLSSTDGKAEYSIFLGGISREDGVIEYEGAIRGEFFPDGNEGIPIFYDNINTDEEKIKEAFNYLVEIHEDYNNLLQKYINHSNV